jgi:hypothetical protein
MSETPKVDTHHKALQINLDPKIFGTFAEIGAGQEVARWFLRVGGASGTVAKTMSAYDMAFSDAIYGQGTRYVSRDRLIAMLDHEYALLLERLDASRGHDSRFFVFADTVSARNFAGTNECHGWLGIRFQSSPRGQPSDILLHVNMMDSENVLQQQALGVLGVNLVHAAYFARGSIETLLTAVASELSLERIEIDVMELTGVDFRGSDQRAIGVALVQGGYGNAVLFKEDLQIVQPSEILRKRPIVVQRGIFRHAEPIHRRILEAGLRRLGCDVGASEREALGLFEMSTDPLGATEKPDSRTIIDRLAELSALGRPILVSRFSRNYQLSGYLRRYTTQPLRFTAGTSTLVPLLQAANYGELMGGLLEGLGILLAQNVRIYVHPVPAAAMREALAALPAGLPAVELPNADPVTAESLLFPQPVEHLYRYLLESGWFESLSLE